MSAKREFAGGAIARYLLLGSAVFLSLFGLLMIFSASSVRDLVKEGSSTYHLYDQAMFLAAGVVAAFVFARIDYRIYQRFLWPMWGVIVGLLGFTAVLGSERLGAKRWISLGFASIQPSEFAKIAVLLIAAALIVEWKRGRLEFMPFVGRLALAVGLPVALILAQDDLGTAAILLGSVVVLLFVAGFPMRWIFGAIGVVVAAAAVAILSSPFRMGRVAAFLNPLGDPLGKGYQTVQALIAFGTGGVSGLGLGMSRQKFFYLPEAHTDFVFAIIGEEIGLMGTLAIVAAFVALIYAGIRISSGARDQYGSLLAMGLTAMLGLQAFVNMAAVTSITPVTGKPLPFVSYGGSSAVVSLIALGLLLSVTQYGMKAPRAVRGPRPKKESSSRESADERGRNGGARVSRPVRGGGSRRRA